MLDAPTMMAKPVRPSDATQGICVSPEADAATRERTVAVLDSTGAAAAGAHGLPLPKEP